MPLISIVTAVLAGIDDHLGELYESLVTQEMPTGWRWEWVLQEDGETGDPLARVPSDDPRILPGTGPHGRAPAARTLALSRVRGELVRAVDADDVLPDDALARDIAAITENPGIAWCVSPAVDVLPDGSLRSGPRDPHPGQLPPGHLAEGERTGLLQVLGVTMCAHTGLVRALGGWPALPSEDVALLLAAEAVSTGWMIGEPGLLYRRWPQSATSHVDKAQPAPAEPHRNVMLDRVDALRATGWRWTPPALPN